MSKPQFSETELRQTLRDAEGRIDRATLNSLADAREYAITSKQGWFSGPRAVFSAGLVTTALVVAVLMPLGSNTSPNIAPSYNIADENLQLLMEDPEFFLWVSNSYSSVSQ